MALPKASSVNDDLKKEQKMNEPVKTAINNADNNGGSGSGGGAFNTTAKEEPNENAILPSPEDLKKFVEADGTSRECLSVVNSIKKDIIQGCGVDKGVWRIYSTA